MRRWLTLLGALVDAHAAELTALDAAIGDGDHGINLQRGFAAVRSAVAPEDGSTTAASLLRLTGRTLVSTVGGAAGPLYGTWFLELALATEDAPLSPPSLGLALERAAGAVARRGRSRTGEKTMLDALVPAAAAWRAAAHEGRTRADCARAARQAADEGRAATEPMVATKGRASYLGERSRGHLDPGAASSALVFAALLAAVDGDQAGVGEGSSR